MALGRNSMFEALTMAYAQRMDVLDELLAGTRAQDGVFNLTILDLPWALEIRDEAPLALATLVRGSGWVTREGTAPQRLEQGDVAIFTGPQPYVVGDSVHTAPQLRIHPGGICEPLPGAPADYSARLGVRTYGSRKSGEVMVASGTYQVAGARRTGRGGRGVGDGDDRE